MMQRPDLKTAKVIAALMCGLASPVLGQTSEAQQFELRGVTAYDPSEILGFAAQVVAQREGSVLPDALARMIEVIYREDGYFLAEVFVSPDGTTLTVDEGEIGSVSIEGVDEDTFRLMSAYMSPVLGVRPVTLGEFERSIMLIEDIGSISATAEITYPQGEDRALVRIIGVEEDRNIGWITVDSPSREFGEAARLGFHQELGHLATAGDLLRVDLSATFSFDGVSDSVFGAASYRRPVGGLGSYVEGYLGNVTAQRDATGVLEQTNIDGKTMVLAFGHPFIRNVDTYGYGLFEVQRIDTDVDEAGTVFESEVDMASLSWIYGKALPAGDAVEVALNYSFGQRTSPAVGVDNGDADFSFVRAGLGYEAALPAIGDYGRFSFEMRGQYSSDRLPAVAEFYVGTVDDNRGYQTAEGQGDTGVSASLEFSRDFDAQQSGIAHYRPFGFVDAGYIRNNDPSGTELPNARFASAGVGVDATTREGLQVRGYVAVPLTDGPDTGAGDAAVYLSMTKSW